MKQILLLLINVTIVTFITFSQTTTFHPFSSSAVWRVDGSYINNVEGCNVNYYYSYYLNGDTTINGNSYKKVYKTAVFADSSGATFPDAPCDPNLAYNLLPGYVGGLRDDETAFKTFIVRKSTTTELLLFDYNLVVGDQVDGEMGPNPGFMVSLVDSVLINGNYRKRWNFDDGGMFSYYIAGIGSKSGFIERSNQSGNSSSNHLVCVRDTNNNSFDSDYTSNYGCISIANNQEMEISQNYELFPNPFSYQTELKLETPIENGNLVIYDLQGSKIMEMSNLSGSEIYIQRASIQNGIYFLKLTENQKLIVNAKLSITE
jgi:hypothetical protein